MKAKVRMSINKYVELFYRMRIPLVFSITLAVLFLLHQYEELFKVEMRELIPGGKYSYLFLYSLNGFAGFITGAIPFALIELTSSNVHEKANRLKKYAFPIMIWACYYVISNIVVFVTTTLKNNYEVGVDSMPFEVSQTGHIILYIILIDFFAYWFHRLEHAVPFLWRFHSTHHSLKSINAFNQYGHWFEGMFRFFVVYLPVSLLVPAPDLSASSIAVIWGVWTLYVHTDSADLSLPRCARYVFVDNLYHHYHHGYEQKYHDKNFSGILSVWDILFGTSLMPENKEFPKTGLKYLEPPSSAFEYITHPFNMRY